MYIYLYNDAMIYNHNNHKLRITGDVIIDQTIRYARKQVQRNNSRRY